MTVLRKQEIAKIGTSFRKKSCVIQSWVVGKQNQVKIGNHTSARELVGRDIAMASITHMIIVLLYIFFEWTQLIWKLGTRS